MNISEAREKCGITQQELAKRLSVTQGAVSQWENGIVFPRVSMLKKIAEVLKCPVDELLREREA